MKPVWTETFRSRRPIQLIGVLAVLLSSAIGAGAVPSTRGLPDRARIHADYEAGDFEKVIRAAEGFLASGRRCPKPDSVFLEKHLSVVYAADPSTRERGRYHMLRMLDLDPQADLLDMFVGEEVDGIFEKVRKESALKRTSESMFPAPSVPKSPAVARVASKPAPVARAASSKPPVSLAAAPKPLVSSSAAPKSVVLKSAAPTPSTARPAPAKSTGANRAAFVPAPAPRLKPWNLGAPADVYPHAPVTRARPAASAVPAPRHPRPAVPASGSTAVSSEADSKPRWKEPGFWVGGGAAVAVVGLTVLFAGSQEWDHGSSRSKTYGVPSRPTP